MGLLGTFRRRRRRTEVELRKSQAYLRMTYERIRDLWSRLLTAQETERSRIARELHDDINQQMALLTMDLDLMGSTDRDETRRLAIEAGARSREIARDNTAFASTSSGDSASCSAKSAPRM